MRAEDIAILVMAGGLSRRFGTEDKLMADLDGLSLGLHVATRLLPLGWAQRLAVALPPLKAGLEGLGYEVLEPAPGNGLGDNLALGAKSLGNVAGVLIVLADMPFVTENHVQALLDAARSTAAVVCTRAGDVWTPPVLIGRDRFTDLVALCGHQGAKKIIETAGAGLIEIEVSKSLAADIDTVADFSVWQGLPERK